MPQHSPKPKETPLNVYMDPQIKKMLLKLASDGNCSMAHVLRDAVSAQYRHRYGNEPHCADCSLCKCPAMHAVRPTERLTDAELVAATQTPPTHANGPNAT